MEKPLTMKKLEELLSGSQITAQFYNLGYGLFNVYLKIYQRYGEFDDPTDSSGKRFNDFKEAMEDIKYIKRRNGGRALLDYWFLLKKDYVNERLFDKYKDRVKYLEGRLIDNRLMSEFVYNELIVKFLEFVDLSYNDELVTKYNFDRYPDGRKIIFPAYLEALESVYKLYIQKALEID